MPLLAPVTSTTCPSNRSFIGIPQVRYVPKDFISFTAKARKMPAKQDKQAVFSSSRRVWRPRGSIHNMSIPCDLRSMLKRIVDEM